MAKWRAIHKKISISPQVSSMSEFAQFLFERAMLHADDWGIVTGDPLGLKLLAIPASQRESTEFDAALNEMEEADLIWRYHPDSHGPLIQFITFDEHQPKILIGNRTEPKQPLHYLHPNYEDYPDLHWKTLENTGKEYKPKEKAKEHSHSKSRSKSVSKKGSERDSRLDHPVIKGYRELARLHMPIPLRDDWIACAEELGIDVLLKYTKEWIGNGWNKRNVNGIMDYARKGGGSGTRKRRDRKDEDLPYDEWAKEHKARRKAED